MNWPLVATFIVAAVLGFEAWRHPVLWRMGARNARRRPRQTATVIAGLMIGTAIVSAALVTGDSAGSAIEEAVYDSLGPIDETIRVDGFPFYPQSAAQAIADDPRVRLHFDAVAPNVIWSAAVDNPRSDLFEPNVQIVGYDPAQDVAFGDFSLVGGQVTDGSFLGPDQAIITASLADSLEARVGDRIELAATLPFDPALPEITQINGSATGLGTAVGPEATVHEVTVADGATRLTVILGWNPGPTGASLIVRATSPDGASWTSQADAPLLWLNATDPDGHPLATGTWTVEVFGNAAVDTRYAGAALVWHPVYDFDDITLQDGPANADIPSFTPPRTTRTLEVAAITDGGRGNQFDFRYAVFAPLPTVQDFLGRPGEINLLKFSNPGGPRDASGTDTAVEILNATLADVQAANPHPAVQALEVNPVKQDFLKLADTAGQLFTGFLLFAGSLSVITGLLLIVNIFTMLAEERRSELGMARAVGLHRRDLVRMFLFEGSLYAILASAVGAVAGIAIAFGLVSGINALGAGTEFPPVPFRVSTANVLTAFSIGALLSFTTIAVTSRRASRLNIVRAIRRIDEPEREPSWKGFLVGAPLLAAGAALAAFGWATNQFSSQIFGPTAMALGVGMMLRRFLPRRRAYPLLATALALYLAATVFLITKFDNIEEANIVGPLRGVLLTFAVVVVIAYWEAGPRWLGNRLARIRRLRAVARPSMAYPQHRRFRTGMTLAMFGIVILSVGVFSIFGNLFQTDPDRQTGGFDIAATTTLDVDSLDDYDAGLLPRGLVTASHRVADYRTFDLESMTVSGEQTGQFGPPVHHVYGITPGFAADQEFRLLWRLDGYADDRAAYEALFERDDVVIVAYPYSTDERNQDLSHEVGEKLQLHLGNATKEYTIIGIQEQFHYRGIFLPQTAVEAMFPGSDDLFLMKIADGQDAEEAARSIERNYRGAGMDAVAVREEVERQAESFQQIMAAMKAYLGLGLVVGTLSLGIITGRSVLERRQEIGMLRALGFTGKQVGAVFFLEVTLIVLVGAIVGILCSLVVTYGLWYGVIRELQYPYVVPWGQLGILAGIAYAVALLATVGPIIRASRIPPAEAVRYVE